MKLDAGALVPIGRPMDEDRPILKPRVRQSRDTPELFTWLAGPKSAFANTCRIAVPGVPS